MAFMVLQAIKTPYMHRSCFIGINEFLMGDSAVISLVTTTGTDRPLVTISG